MNTEIRRAREEDKAQLFTLVSAFATSFPGDAAVFPHLFDAILKDENACCLVASANEEVYGYCLGVVHQTFYANGKVAYLEEIMVAETHRRLGAGKALMQEFENWAHANGAILSGLATRRAADFYKAIDYEESAIYFRKIL